MQKTRLTAKELAISCKFVIMNEDKITSWTEITSPGIYRAGLELSGFVLSNSFQKNVIVWGTKEQRWFELVGKKKMRESLNNLFKTKPPVVFLSLGVEEEYINEILVIANKYEVPVISCKLHVTEILSEIGDHLILRFAKHVGIHASLVVINGMGVMIIGKSGVGKSEAVIELIQDGHMFVSDDTVNIWRVGKNFFGRPAEITRDILEARGIGLLDIKKIFGMRSIRNSAKIELVVDLIDAEHEDKEFDRLGNRDLKYEILGSSIPKIEIPVKRGKSVKALITAAANIHVAKQGGFDAYDTIQERIKTSSKEV